MKIKRYFGIKSHEEYNKSIEFTRHIIEIIIECE